MEYSAHKNAGIFSNNNHMTERINNTAWQPDYERRRRQRRWYDGVIKSMTRQLFNTRKILLLFSKINHHAPKSWYKKNMCEVAHIFRKREREREGLVSRMMVIKITTKKRNEEGLVSLFLAHSRPILRSTNYHSFFIYHIFTLIIEEW